MFLKSNISLFSREKSKKLTFYFSTNILHKICWEFVIHLEIHQYKLIFFIRKIIWWLRFIFEPWDLFIQLTERNERGNVLCVWVRRLVWQFDCVCLSGLLFNFYKRHVLMRKMRRFDAKIFFENVKNILNFQNYKYKFQIIDETPCQSVYDHTEYIVLKRK